MYQKLISASSEDHFKKGKTGKLRLDARFASNNMLLFDLLTDLDLQSLNWVNNNNNNSHEHDHHNDAESIAAAAADQQDDATTTFPLYTQKYHPAAVHSITARNLSSRVRDELK